MFRNRRRELPQRFYRDEGILPFPGRSLRAGQPQSIVEIVGEEAEERPVDFNRLVPFLGGFAVPTLYPKPLLARQVRRKFKCSLGLLPGLLVVTEDRPRRSQGCRGKGMVWIALNRFL